MPIISRDDKKHLLYANLHRGATKKAWETDRDLADVAADQPDGELEVIQSLRKGQSGQAAKWRVQTNKERSRLPRVLILGPSI